ncbi:MAG TPA: type III pantothenate kinase [Gaiellales bacterium]|nr:type III pantothenate kinase [Gaiellales bacterium]
MLLTIDVGNTQTVVGLYDGDRLAEHWRTASVRGRTADEVAVELQGLLAVRGRGFADVTATVASSGVPQLAEALRQAASVHLGHEALIVGPATDHGLELRVENPPEVGPDRIANCVAALALAGGPLVVVDFGTAINFDAVSADGAFLGGAIAPGLQVAVEALGERAARLFQIELRAPDRAIGRTTAENMQSGAIFGYAGLVDGLVRRFAAELGGRPSVIATGGLATVVAPHCDTVDRVEPWLTLEGLRLIWQRAGGKA